MKCGGGKMNVIIIIVLLAALGLLGIVTKSIFAILLGIGGIAVSFLVFCTGALLGILGKIIAIISSLAIIGAAILFVPVALFVIIPGIYFAFLYARKNGHYRPGNDMAKKIIQIEP
jgi:hypothetical protein